ncbi:hypothetical protein ARMGADRAFT_1056943 [Armillaria gallica]|uniref:Uncharacterized protein n=1 Tax=Armillaria gallica TaxID=47427 RepID=A0A2H3ECD7_ARMGA|nr:hypothetical protein ARMGADRAFT_1056943 [Armillaria gallica]
MKWIKRRSGVKRRIQEDGVDLAILTVDVLRATATAATSIPALGAAAGIVSCIFQQISQAQQNTELALRIAARCARALATISKHLETLVITSAVLDNIKSFETNLYEIQDFIEKETSRNVFYLTIFAKQRAGRLQELQSRIQETMTLFQITTLITLHDIAQRISAGDLGIDGGVSGQGRLETTPNEPDGPTVEELDVIPEEELRVGKGFRLLLAQVGGKDAVLIKVFEGEDAQENRKKTVNFEKHLMFVLFSVTAITFRFICTLQASKPSASKTMLRRSYFTLHSLRPRFQATAEKVVAEQVIAASIPQGVIPTFIVGAQLISGVACSQPPLRRGQVERVSISSANCVIRHSTQRMKFYTVSG